MATVRIGSAVTLQLGQGDEPEHWKIVDASEADATRGVISPETPLARALIGHQAGETVQVRGPESRYTVTILDVV